MGSCYLPRQKESIPYWSKRVLLFVGTKYLYSLLFVGTKYLYSLLVQRSYYLICQDKRNLFPVGPKGKSFLVQPKVILSYLPEQKGIFPSIKMELSTTLISSLTIQKSLTTVDQTSALLHYERELLLKSVKRGHILSSVLLTCQVVCQLFLALLLLFTKYIFDGISAGNISTRYLWTVSHLTGHSYRLSSTSLATAFVQ